MPVVAGGGDDEGAGSLAQAPRPIVAAARTMSARYFMDVCVSPLSVAGCRCALCQTDRLHARQLCFSRALQLIHHAEMPEEPPAPPPLLPVLAVILIVDVIVVGVLAYNGVLQRLPPSAQFIYGMTMFGFPVLVYVLLKSRRNRGE